MVGIIVAFCAKLNQAASVQVKSDLLVLGSSVKQKHLNTSSDLLQYSARRWLHIAVFMSESWIQSYKHFVQNAKQYYANRVVCHSYSQYS